MSSKIKDIDFGTKMDDNGELTLKKDGNATIPFSFSDNLVLHNRATTSYYVYN